MPAVARECAAFVNKLAARAGMSADEQAKLTDAIDRVVAVKARTDLVRQGDRPQQVYLLIDGFAASYKLGSAGERQILRLHLPEEGLDFHLAMLGVADHSIVTLSNCRGARIPRLALTELLATCPGVARGFWMETLIDGAMGREWMLNIGRRDTYARVAHLFCEISVRMKALGRCNDGRFEFPITQIELADAMSVTPVHMNRTIQALRGDGLLSMSGYNVTIHDWDLLATAADFDPAYLYLEPQRTTAAMKAAHAT